ncbi:MAG: ABC transporter substrate-binding protein [Rhodospirillales bacterium CG15_BIG_FIL_POST_REV_8_21_14_020_66_15]|nr:MAG: ABC transporter substrate-binding protein [Rhodospirillales bacterium CG15_BIG_FIL_POST_REV_8_21_14_020_66_15]
MHVRKSMIAAAAAACLAVGLATAAQAQTITIGLGTEPTSIDPHYHNLGPNNQIAQHIFSRLIEQDHKQRLLPGLATEWKAVDDTTWEFKLRKGVKFHDGSEFNVDDVLFSMERAAAHPNAKSSFKLYSHGGEKTYERVDDYTFRVKTPAPYPLMAVDLSNVHIVSDKSKGHWEGDFNNGSQAAGTGPYKFVRWVKGEILEFERNESYWGKKPHWKHVVIKPIKSSPSRLAALLAGDVDFIDQVPTIDVAGLKKNPKVSLSQGISNRVIYLHLDQSRDVTPFAKGLKGEEIKNPFKDVRVRKAISKAINRDLIIERVMEGIAVPAGQLLPDGFFGVSDKLKPDAYDPKGAKKLLAAAGYPDGFQTTLHGPNDRYINDAKIAEAVAQMLSRVGIRTTPETMPKSVYFKRAKNGGPAKPPEFSFMLVGWGSGTGEASSPLRSLLATYSKEKSWGPSNRGLYSNPKMDEVLTQALATVDDAKRAALLAKATEIALGQDMGLIPLHYQVNTWAARKGLKYLARTDERTVAYDIVPE